MYRAFYGLREKPFNLTPDPRFLYLSDKHKEAFAHLVYGIRSRTGFVMVTGEIGTGKTTICRNLLNQLDEDTELAFIFNPMLSPFELLKKIASEFGVDTKGANTLELTEELNQYLLEAAAKGRNCVLLIDEAQNLDPQVLEQVRLLSNLETETEKLLQIVLIGQPELGEKLALHELRQLNQRITARYHLRPLSREEVMQYVAYRLHVAGGRRKVKFAKSAVRAIYKISGGTPRVINALCDRALLIGFTKEVHTITAPIVHRAYREIRGDDIFGKGESLFRLRRYILNPIAGITIAVVIAIAFANSPVLRQRAQGYVDRLASYLPEAEPVVLAPREVLAATNPHINPEEIASAANPGVEATVAPGTPVEGPTNTVSPATATAQPVPESFLEGSEAHATLAALGNLLAAWKKEAKGDIPASLDGEMLDTFSRENGLAVEMLNPAIDQLLALDLPAIVHLDFDGAIRAATLTAAKENDLTLSSGDHTWVMDRGSFKKHYTGDAVVLWDDPAPNAAALMPGSRSAGVRALRTQLAALGRIDNRGNADTYDGEVSKAVARLQAETSLDVDGIAGKQVRMVLRSWAKPAGTPGLGDVVARNEAKDASPSDTIADAPSPAIKVDNPVAAAAEQTPPAVALAANEPEPAAKAPAVETPQADEAVNPPAATDSEDSAPVAETATEPAPTEPTPPGTDTTDEGDGEKPVVAEDKPAPITISNVGEGRETTPDATEEAQPGGEEGEAQIPASPESAPASSGPQITVVKLADPGIAPPPAPGEGVLVP